MIATRVGQEGLLRFYRLVGSTPGDGDQAVAAALRSILHETIAEFTTQWKAYVRTQL